MPNPVFEIEHLQSGGLITNYYCTSRCAHCLYACSPNWPKYYLDPEVARKNMLKIMELGCSSIHIGGGEPFLNPEGLKAIVETAVSLGMAIEYVETNSSWYKDMGGACTLLESLREKGLTCLLVSISPFHNEHIPLWKVKGVMEACGKVGIRAFPWIPEFCEEIEALGDSGTHKLSEFEEKYGPGYLKGLPSRYWIHWGGRAIKTYAEIFGSKPFEEVLREGGGRCLQLLDVSHFHLDLFGNYVPGLCSGLAIEREDLGTPISTEKYPHLSILFQAGVRGLYELASNKYEFKPSESYMSACHLCLEIRKHLVLNKDVNSPDLQPIEFYGQL